MVIDKKYQRDLKDFIRDTRTPYARFRETAEDPFTAGMVMAVAGGFVYLTHFGQAIADFLGIAGALYFWWLTRRVYKAPLKLPAFARQKDMNEKSKKAAGILHLGNEKAGNDELWLNGKDAGTHILFLGTTGSGKTEGLKSLVSNALTWGSGFIYIDGKADTDLWASIYALARRFGRDDDLFVLNYLTGNSDLGSVSNTINPFTTGSSSYLTNLLVSLMDEAKGENAMWKGRAVALLGALMPVLTWRRENLGIPLDVKVILDSISLQSIIRLSRDQTVPDRVRNALSTTYLETLPGYIAAAFDDDGNEAPPGPNDPPRDMSTVSQQHNFLSMQFTRALQSLSGDYWHIFGNQVADVVMQDIVLNRRILVVLIPSLEKSADEAANLGKIVTASIKGMMGTTLGSSVEGDWSGVIDNKLSKSSSPFMTVFDEVGYYATAGMAVMAAQARSLGFSLIFASQDIPSMELRVREEARSITANCNLKIFGKLEESLDTQNFFEKTVGQTLVTETSGMSQSKSGGNYYDGKNASLNLRAKAGWGDLRDQVEGEVHLTWQSKVIAGRLFYAAPKRVKAMRVHKLLGVQAPEMRTRSESAIIRKLAENLRNPAWTASVGGPAEELPELTIMAEGFKLARNAKFDMKDCGTMAIAALAAAAQQDEEPEQLEDAQGHNLHEVLDYDSDNMPMPISDEVEDESFDEVALDEDFAEPDEGEGLALPSPDHELDDALAGLVDPRRVAVPAAAAAITMPDSGAELPSTFHPGLTSEVDAILKSAARRMAAGISGDETDLAAQ
jgi:intracellular multiplication protein IcmO